MLVLLLLIAQAGTAIRRPQRLNVLFIVSDDLTTTALRDCRTKSVSNAADRSPGGSRGPIRPGLLELSGVQSVASVVPQWSLS